MSAFTGPLTLTHRDVDWREWELVTPLSYEVGFLGSGRVITVDPGFVTDGASVPQFLWVILPPWGRYSRAAVIHDLLCRLINAGTPHIEAPTRERADAIFHEAMGVLGVNRIVRFVMWTAVRLYAIWSGKK
jgi:hypothetical protein